MPMPMPASVPVSVHKDLLAEVQAKAEEAEVVAEGEGGSG